MRQALKPYWALLRRYLRPEWRRFAVLAGLLLTAIGLQLVSPQIIGDFIDAAQAGAPAQQLALAGLAFLIINLLKQGVMVGVNFLSERVGWAATNSLRNDLARHVLNLDMHFHKQHSPGELIERIDGDVNELATFFSQFVVLLVGNLLLIGGILVVLLLQDWRIGAGMAIFAVLAVMMLLRLRTVAVADQKSLRQATADLFGFIEEQLSGAEDIRSNGALSYSTRQLFRLQREMFVHDKSVQKKRWSVEIYLGGFITIAMLLAILGGYYLYNLGAITIGQIYMVVFYLNILENPLWALTREVQSFQTIEACIQRVNELLAVQPQIVDGPGAELAPGRLGLRFEDVHFAYEDGESLLTGLTFRLEPGARLGLLGRTGSGKTTLARLALRLYDPQSGSICLDGVNLKEPTTAALRQRIGMVTQEVQLFQGTLRDNLTFFDRSVSDVQIAAAISALELDDWYRGLPAGLDTVLGQGSQGLSAGEAQLLAFTRILLRDPGLVILDEASSRLDPATERRIERAVAHLLENRTAIIIAHRLSTVERVDQIMILDGGQVLEYGQRQALAENPDSRFHHLLEVGLEEVLV